MATRATQNGRSGLLDDRSRLGRVLVGVGAIGVIAALVVGIVGWILAARTATVLAESAGPIVGIVDNVAETIEASQTLVARTTEAIESIEQATRSTARTIVSVNDVLAETADLAGVGLADSLDSAVDSLPGLVSTGRVIDRTMRALSLVGVDYDPAVPLDEALADLETSLMPIPDQIRQQADLLETVEDDLAGMADDAGQLAAVLLEARLDMMRTAQVLESASVNAADAAGSVRGIESSVATFGGLARLVALAAAISLLSGATAALLGGLHLTRSAAGQPSDQAAK